jgi:hypothetical protein
MTRGTLGAAESNLSRCPAYVPSITPHGTVIAATTRRPRSGEAAKLLDMLSFALVYGRTQ